jgi:hypothetical protein
MDRIGKGAVNGRVCIVLSDKYLRSVSTPFLHGEAAPVPSGAGFAD